MCVCVCVTDLGALVKGLSCAFALVLFLSWWFRRPLLCSFSLFPSFWGASVNVYLKRLLGADMRGANEGSCVVTWLVWTVSGCGWGESWWKKKSGVKWGCVYVLIHTLGCGENYSVRD